MIRCVVAVWLAKRALRKASDGRVGRLRVVAEAEIGIWRRRKEER